MKLGFTEEQVMAMTVRKFFMLFDEYQYMNGLKKEGDDEQINLLP